jgi:hypothetical protein
MATETIELEVDPETARRYREAGPEERARAESLLYAWLARPADRAAAGAALRAAMRKTSQEAKANGMTPEILEELLRED